MELTPEEKQKIYAEEKAKLEAQKVLKKQETDKKSKKYLIWLAVIVPLMIIFMAMGTCNEEKNKASIQQGQTAMNNFKMWVEKNVDKDKTLYAWEYQTIRPSKVNNYKYTILHFTANVKGLSKKQAVGKAEHLVKEIYKIMHSAYPDLVIDVDLFYNNGKSFAGGYIWHPEAGYQPRNKLGDAFYK
ncbi:MAG: hypothetical protein KJ620_07420 [Candidatus Edwardsbacteria bacterium]|nr:hypothetical protein [Candidatus Edwardsbacteria bacterium]MBU1577755.1 hypothetical protein [Candidatus Edwardsbacteria bacterium]MBU2594690.1 hypothetical protein [Candidatus Edwardsbacteria bacterium]